MMSADLYIGQILQARIVTGNEIAVNHRHISRDRHIGPELIKIERTDAVRNSLEIGAKDLALFVGILGRIKTGLILGKEWAILGLGDLLSQRTRVGIFTVEIEGIIEILPAVFSPLCGTPKIHQEISDRTQTDATVIDGSPDIITGILRTQGHLQILVLARPRVGVDARL